MQLSEVVGMFRRKYVVWGMVGVGIGLCALALWFVPVLRGYAEQGYAWGRHYVGGESGEVAEGTGTAFPSPSASATPSLLETVTQLEERVKNLEIQQVDQKEAVTAVGTQLKAAVAEISKTNDILDKRQEEWLAALKKVGVVSQSSTSGESVSGVTATAEPASSGEAKTGKVNLNTASLADLDGLPGIGPTYAQRILDYREQKGKFTSIEDVQNVTGIGPSIFAKIKDQIEV